MRNGSYYIAPPGLVMLRMAGDFPLTGEGAEIHEKAKGGMGTPEAAKFMGLSGGG